MAIRVSMIRQGPAVGSHVKLGEQYAQSASRVYIISTWAIENTSEVPAKLDFRVRLNWAKSWGDDTWFEYAPQDGVRTDIFSREGGSPAITNLGSKLGSGVITTPVPGRARIDFPMGIILPGPSTSPTMQAFWSRQAYYDFNFLVAPHQVHGDGFTRLGEHEFKQFMRLHMEPSGALRAVALTRGIQSPTLDIFVA